MGKEIFEDSSMAFAVSAVFSIKCPLKNKESRCVSSCLDAIHGGPRFSTEVPLLPAKCWCVGPGLSATDGIHTGLSSSGLQAAGKG